LVVLVIVITLIQSIPGRIRYYRLSKAGILETDSMTGRDFELWLKSIYGRMGYKAKVTRASKDKGADLIVTDLNGIKVAVQAKKLAKGKIGPKPIGEVLRGKNYYGCNKAIVVTNQYFTKQAIEEAKINRVELWNRNRLLKEIERIEKVKKKSAVS